MLLNIAFQWELNSHRNIIISVSTIPVAEQEPVCPQTTFLLSYFSLQDRKNRIGVVLLINLCIACTDHKLINIHSVWCINLPENTTIMISLKICDSNRFSRNQRFHYFSDHRPYSCFFSGASILTRRTRTGCWDNMTSMVLPSRTRTPRPWISAENTWHEKQIIPLVYISSFYSPSLITFRDCMNSMPGWIMAHVSRKNKPLSCDQFNKIRWGDLIHIWLCVTKTLVSQPDQTHKKQRLMHYSASWYRSNGGCFFCHIFPVKALPVSVGNMWRRLYF